MSIVAYFDHIPYFTGDILLGALIDTGVDPQKLEDILNQYHGIGSKIDLKLGETHGTKVVSVSVSATKKLRRESIWATLTEGKDSPAGELIGKVISNIETHAKTCEKGGNLISLADDDWDASNVITRILALCNALNLQEIETLYHEPLPFSPGVLNSPPFITSLMQGINISCAHSSDGVVMDIAGISVLTALSARTRSIPDFTLQKIGYSVLDIDGDPKKFVRLCLGKNEPSINSDSVDVLETQIDDMNPQFYGHVIDLLLRSGALDAFLTPLIMKKNRPGVLLTVLSPPSLTDLLTKLIFKETTTLGIRRSTTSREILPRREVPVITPLGTVRIKVVYLENKWRYTPEYEDCRQIALRKSIPLADVYAAVHEKAGHMNLGKTS